MPGSPYFGLISNKETDSDQQQDRRERPLLGHLHLRGLQVRFRLPLRPVNSQEAAT